jgi:hypothetical protein
MKFKNLSLNNDWDIIKDKISDVYFNDNLEGIEVVTNDPLAYTTYLYHGKNIDLDLQSDMELIQSLINI